MRSVQEAELYRACDVAPGRLACPVFWTLGRNQVGKGALTGWKEVLLPALRTGTVDLWPFDGSFDDLLSRGRTVFVETYPGDVYPYVGFAQKISKRVQKSRAASADGIVAWAHEASINLSPPLVKELHDGFSADADGEDRFDAVMGLLGMLAGLRSTCRKPATAARRIGCTEKQATPGWT